MRELSRKGGRDRRHPAESPGTNATPTRYIQAALRHARYEILEEDRSYYGEIPGFDGVYANQAELEACREELREVLEEWILLRLSRGLPLAVVDGIELRMTAQA